MNINLDTKMLNISAYAEGYYSGATAYGEVLLPEEVAKKYKESLSELEIYVGELDGKHSECECDIDFEHGTLKQILINSMNDSEVCDEDITEKLICHVCDAANISYNSIEDLLRQIMDIKILLTPENKEIRLVKDTEIQGEIIPKDTVISFNKNKDIDKSKISFEFDFEELEE